MQFPNKKTVFSVIVLLTKVHRQEFYKQKLYFSTDPKHSLYSFKKTHAWFDLDWFLLDGPST